MTTLAARTIAPALVVLLAAAGLVLTPASSALTIEGLHPLVPLTLHKAAASVKDQRLEVKYPDGRLGIHPWPDYLPRHLRDQLIQAERQLWPSGPSERVAFTRHGETDPWLILGSQSRTTTPILGEWQLVFDEGKWFISDGTKRMPLAEKGRAKQPACIVHAGKRWQIHLLPESSDSTSRSSLSEFEPRASWLALRQ
ncbi:hypothetical protein EDC30_101390 [Paucimonas lemoignei]|uniref:Uncharacterized protein n=1 Tax=Paucimonas lemoignei TaxID=29443 RepID=A0A4R3I2H8_PAULE|nr:hypothetical protein [Paucimonas lemoignei]TCS39434.1 hypothetical protein EDC30_101390 [Paucimonas lemoignei]